MRKEVKSTKLVTALLTWGDSTRGEAIKSEGEEKGERRKRCEVSDV